MIPIQDINIGMAAALPSGNLIVPVIKNADRYNLVGLAKSVNDLARRARNNELSPRSRPNIGRLPTSTASACHEQSRKP